MKLPPLRPYQREAVSRVLQLEKAGATGICLQSPTGSGKALIMSQFLIDGTPQMLLTPRRTLLDQMSNVLDGYGIGHGLRASGKPTNLSAPIQLGMLQSEFNNAHKKSTWPLHDCRRLLIDEIHTNTAGMAVKVIDTYQQRGASFIGVTATPVELGHICQEQVVAATYSELTAQGWLVPALVFTPDGPALNKLENVKRQKNGEFSPSELKRIWSTEKIFGSVTSHYRRLNPEGVPAVLFAGGVAESLWFARQLTSEGINSAHMDGSDVWLEGKRYSSDSKVRKTVFDGMKSGDIKCLCNRFVAREGLDLPQIGHVILACVFGSRASFTQAIGRGLRPSPEKKHLVLQDHGGNAWRWPVESWDEPWDMTVAPGTLEKIRVNIRRGETNERHPEYAIADPIVCPECAACRTGGIACPMCGFVYEKRTRPVMQLDGSLTLVSAPMYAPRRVFTRLGDEEVWERIFWANKKNHPDRTPEQARAFYAYQNSWRWLPRNLKLMPIRDRHWHVPFGQLEFEDLIA